MNNTHDAFLASANAFRDEANAMAETLRCARLAELGVIGKPLPVLDKMMEVICLATSLPSAVLTFIADDYAFIKACYNGPPLGQEERAVAFCNTTITQPTGSLVVTDATQDDRFKNNPKVISGMLACYAGVTVKTNDGVPLGALCIAAPTARDITDEEMAMLRRFAEIIGDIIQMQ